MMQSIPADSQDEVQVVVLSGPSGSGKTTIVQRLLDESPVKLLMSVSATTRSPRDAEMDGRDYYFLTDDQFQERRQGGELLEWAEVHKTGHWYGTLCSELDRARESGAWALLEVDVEGALNVIQRYPDAVTIFLTTPSIEVYEQRLRDRGTETEEVIQRRLQTARDELESSNRYRHIVVNDDLDRAVREICGILAARKADLEGSTH
jgi:guanylate kinase